MVNIQYHYIAILCLHMLKITRLSKYYATPATQDFEKFPCCVWQVIPDKLGNNFLFNFIYFFNPVVYVMNNRCYQGVGMQPNMHLIAKEEKVACF